jgi:hypothetical protein
MNLELYTVFTTGRSEKEPGHGFLEGGFLRNKFYKGEISLHKPGSERAHAEGVRGSDGAGGSGRASEEQQASGQH